MTTPKGLEALRLLAERTTDRSPDPGVLGVDETFADDYNVYIHWSTARVLLAADLITYTYLGSGPDDPTCIAITDAGREALAQTLGRTP